MFLYALNGAIHPFVYVGSLLFALLKLIFDLLWPVKAVVSIVIRSSFTLVWNVLCLPYTILHLFYSSFFSFFAFLRSFTSSVNTVSGIAPTSAEAQETFSMIAYGTQLCIQWS